MFHLFLVKTNGEVANYKIDDAWPVIIDEFVEFLESGDKEKEIEEEFEY